MEEELRQALRDDQLELHYQPILALADGEVHQLEALRWRHPTQGLLGRTASSAWPKPTA